MIVKNEIKKEELDTEINALLKEIKKYKNLRDKDYFENVFNISALPQKFKEFSDKDLSMIVVSLDGFKKLADPTQSHSVGINALALTARITKKNLVDVEHILFRPQDKYFLALISNADRNKVNRIAENIRNDMKSALFNVKGEKKTLTVSQGICYLKTQNLTMNDISKMIYSSLMAIRNNKTIGGEDILAEHSGALIEPDSYTHERLFPKEMIKNLQREEEIGKIISKMNDKTSFEYYAKLKELKNMLRDSAAIDEVSHLYKKSYLLNNLDSNSLMGNLYFKSKEQPYSLLILDIDNMHQLVKKYGSQIGNKAIRKVAEKVLKNCGLNMVPCLYGGDEMVVIAPNTNEIKIKQLAEKIRAEVETIVLEEDGTSPLRISAGTTTRISKARTINEYVKEIELMIDDADKGLYFAKDNGKNQVVSYESLFKKNCESLHDYNKNTKNNLPLNF
jgi:diguanylate cyclase (GGDEF)-like protein